MQQFEKLLTSVSKKKRKRLEKLTVEQLSSYELRVFISDCCKNLNLDEAIRAYDEAKNKNIKPTFETCSNLLSLAAGLGTQGSSSGPKRVVEPPQNMDAAFTVFNDMKLMEMFIPESAYTAIIRCCCQNNSASKALQFFREMQLANLTPRLRTFNHLLAALSTAKMKDECISVFHDLTSKYLLTPLEEDYINILKLFHFTNDEQLFYEYLENMREDILIPSASTWTFFREWFSSRTMANNENLNKIAYKIEEKECNEQGIITIDNIPFQLQSITLSETDRLSLLSQIDSIASKRSVDRFDTHTHPVLANSLSSPVTLDTLSEENIIPSSSSSSLSISTNHKNLLIWNQFKISVNEILQRKDKVNNGIENPTILPSPVLESFPPPDHHIVSDVNKLLHSDIPFDVLVDGANIGYYKQNYPGAPSHVEYTQINDMLLHLTSKGYQPLLVIHNRHLLPGAYPDSVATIIESWKQSKRLLVTPGGSNDDWFWMYAAVALQCKLVSNDEMRDHRFQMLSPRWFGRWKERHQIRFSIYRHFHNNNNNNNNHSDTTISNSNTNSSNALINQYDNSIVLSQDESNSNNYQKPLQSTFEYPFFQRQITIYDPLPYSKRIQILIHRNNNNHHRRSFFFPCIESEKWLCVIDNHILNHKNNEEEEEMMIKMSEEEVPINSIVKWNENVVDTLSDKEPFLKKKKQNE